MEIFVFWESQADEHIKLNREVDAYLVSTGSVFLSLALYNYILRLPSRGRPVSVWYPR